MSMKVLILVGGRQNGHTDALCNHLVSCLPKGFSTDLMDITSMDVAHCTGCGSCSLTGRCRFDDDMSVILESFDEADVVLFATPVRFNGMSSQIKTVIDRFQLVWNSSDMVEHRVRFMGLLMTAGSDNPNPEPNLRVFRAFCNSFGGIWIGSALLSGTDFGYADYAGCARRMADQLMSSVSERQYSSVHPSTSNSEYS